MNARAAALAPAFALALPLAAALALPFAAALALADEIDPPVDAPDNTDVTYERADSMAAGSVEVELGLDGRGNSTVRRARALRFSGADLDGTLREGGDDPLDGADVGGRSETFAWRVGRNAPQWGRGWLVGSPRAPWSDAHAESEDRLRTGPRGDVAWAEAGGPVRLEALAGRFARRDVAAMRVGAGIAGLSAAATHAGLAGAGLSLESDSLGAELAGDRAGRWRGEVSALASRPIGRLGVSARAGSGGFRSLLAPSRSGPSQALGVSWERGLNFIRPRAAAALWRFGSGGTGARAVLEVGFRLDHHAVLRLGVEEQHGVRREGAAPRGMRQGWWGEWRGGSEHVRLEMRLEAWGGEAFAREPARGMSRAAVEGLGPHGARLRIEHAVFRSGSGESLRLPEFDSDRVVLRALSGVGERTRVELNLPGPAGRMRAGWSYTAAARPPSRTQWSLRWARSARLKGATS